MQATTLLVSADIAGDLEAFSVQPIISALYSLQIPVASCQQVLMQTCTATVKLVSCNQPPLMSAVTANIVFQKPVGVCQMSVRINARKLKTSDLEASSIYRHVDLQLAIHIARMVVGL